MSWDYSDMSHEAKLAGGPEKWIENIKLNAETNGEKKMFPIVIGVGIATSILGSIVTNIFHWVKKDKVSNEIAKKSKENLISTLKENDKHTEKQENANNNSNLEEQESIENKECKEIEGNYGQSIYKRE